MPNQIFDEQGTTQFQFTFIDKNKKTLKKIEWTIFFAQGYILIENNRGIRIKINYPEENHWVYEEGDSSYHEGSFCHSAEIKNNEFTLKVDVREYLEPGDSDYDPEYDTGEDPEGYLDLDNKTIRISIIIPYKLARNLMKFMTGSTQLDNICGVIKKN